jgi:hypothetical protein
MVLDPNDPTVQAIRAMVGANATALARLNEHLQAMLPVYIDEAATGSSIAASTLGTVTIAPERDTYFKVTGIFISVPLNTVSASLQLGKLVIPIQNTTTFLSPIQKILKSTDVRLLTFTTGSANGGSATVWLWGEAIPSVGIL